MARKTIAGSWGRISTPDNRAVCKLLSAHLVVGSNLFKTHASFAQKAYILI
jgi:hypothetical protein